MSAALTGLALVGAWTLAQRGIPAGLLATVLVVGAILSLRVYRMGVTCTDSALVVRRLFSTRTISRSAISSVQEGPRMPGVSWRAENGKSRWIPLLLFNGGLPFTRRLKDSQLSKIMKWYNSGSER